jgi:hypothetical protein
MRRSIWLFAVLCLGLSACASHRTALDLQRPPVPNALVFAVPPGHPFYHTVVIDYISGMSKYSHWFAEANQSAFRPQLQKALEDSSMSAPTAISARYGLQIEFTELRTSPVGVTLESRSRAIYRIIDRRTGQIAFQSPVESDFRARFVGLNEEDALIAGTVIGAPIDAALFVRPGNFVASNNLFGDHAEVRAHTLNGDLARSGFGSRDGFVRAKQADFQMMRQSIAKFVMALAADQRLPMTQVLPCLSNTDIAREKANITARGMRWVQEDCGSDNDRTRIVY